MKIKSLIKKIFALSIVSGFIFTSCNTETEYIETTALNKDATIVNYYLQNEDCTNFFLKKEDTEKKFVRKGTTITELAKNYDGFSAVNMTLVTLPNGESAVNVFYERNTVVLSIKTGSKTYTIKGLFDTPTKLPDDFSKPGAYVSFLDSFPPKFPANPAVYRVSLKTLDDFIDMKDIPAGSVKLGSDVCNVSSLKISATEIPQDLYLAIMGNNPSNLSKDPVSGENKDKRPVDSVSFYDALVFCNKLSVKEGFDPVYSIKGTTDTNEWGDIPNGNDDDWNVVEEDPNANGFRLPHKDEFVFAALGDNANSYNGDDWTYFSGCIGSSSVKDYAWYKGNSDGKTHEVAKLKPNSYGLYDMSGNVWEICWDLKDNNKTKHLRLCGSFNSHNGEGEGAGNCAIQEAWDIPSNDRYDDTGFRVVRKAN